MRLQSRERTPVDAQRAIDWKSKRLQKQAPKRKHWAFGLVKNHPIYRFSKQEPRGRSSEPSKLEDTCRPRRNTAPPRLRKQKGESHLIWSPESIDEFDHRIYLNYRLSRCFSSTLESALRDSLMWPAATRIKPSTKCRWRDYQDRYLNYIGRYSSETRWSFLIFA